MEQELIRLLDEDLECTACRWKKSRIVMEIRSVKNQIRCPYCGSSSTKVHSAYQREIQDIPLLDKQTILLLFARKIFCQNPDCEHKNFSERFEFVAPNGKKTKRLVERILITSVKMSSVSASCLLKTETVQASKSSICDLLKKNAKDYG